MENETVIQVNGVSKKFCRSLKRSMWYGFKDILRDTAGLAPKSDHLRKKEFWAVDDVSFELKKGEILGLIGPNGAGKSTILKMLNGIVLPDKGNIEIKGRVGALIHVGAGFHPQLTGRENIYINGAILGMSKREIDKKYDAIVEFADIGDFLDTPVKHYSSGMHVRLGFAIAAHCEPDILLVDEVLAVGDINFQKRCLEKIISFQREGKSIVFVSHNLLQIETFCNKCAFLMGGEIKHIGEIRDAIASYVNSMNMLKAEKAKSRTANKHYSATGTGEIKIEKVELSNKNGQITNEFDMEDDVCIRISYDAKQKIELPNFIITLNLFGSIRVLMLNSKIEGTSPASLYGQGKLEVTLRNMRLLPDTYSLDVYVKDSTDELFYDTRKNAALLIVRVPRNRAIPYRISGGMGIVSVTGEWRYV